MRRQDENSNDEGGRVEEDGADFKAVIGCFSDSVCMRQWGRTYLSKRKHRVLFSRTLVKIVHICSLVGYDSM